MEIVSIRTRKDRKRTYYTPIMNGIKYGEHYHNIAHALGLSIMKYNLILKKYGALNHRWGYYFPTLELARAFNESDELLGLLVMNKLIK